MKDADAQSDATVDPNAPSGLISAPEPAVNLRFFLRD
jgi:hypothetical protein